MSAIASMTPTGPAAEEDGREPGRTDNLDEGPSALAYAARNQTNSSRPRSARVVSFERGLPGGGLESSDSEWGVSDGLQTFQRCLSGDAHFSESPIATQNPTFADNPSVNEVHVNGSLRSQLNDALVKSEFNRTAREFFLPRSEVDRLVHAQSVKEYWLGHTKNLDHNMCSDVVDYVCGHKSRRTRTARLVFVVLVFVDEPALVLDFLKDKVYDDDLPLVSVKEHGLDFQLARRNDTHRRPVRCFNNWAASQRHSFEKLQWQVAAPVIPKLQRRNHQSELQIFEMDDRDILPIVEYDPDSKVKGNSEVVRVKIHKAHLHDSPGNEEDQSFALKSLNSEDLLEFRLEVKALMKIRPKEHLVSALAAFKYQNRYHLLFRWADGGNLANLWQSKPKKNYDSVCWLAQQCYGLVDGLHGIHDAKLSESEVSLIRDTSPTSPQAQILPSNLSFETVDIPDVKGENQDCGRHGDIKPQNILWFKQDRNKYGHGVLRLSDFGLTTFHSALTTKQPAKGVPVTYTYAAPERDLDSDLSRPFDIWSLGCVYLEFITWFLVGAEQLGTFKKRRLGQKDDRTKFITDEFYSIYRENDRPHATIRKPVTEWIQYLKDLEACSDFFSDFLDYIQTKMMVVDKSGRDNCFLVKAHLRAMFAKCRKNRNYAISIASEPVTPTSDGNDGLLIEVRDTGSIKRNGGANAKKGHRSITERVKEKLRSLGMWLSHLD